VRAKQFIFRGRSEVTVPYTGFSKARAIPAAIDAKFLTAALVSCRACAACRGFGCARNTATTSHVLYRLQVTNFSLLKSAPNGVNYIDVRRLFLHGRSRA
jgi:hypothetical protein